MSCVTAINPTALLGPDPYPFLPISPLLTFKHPSHTLAMLRTAFACCSAWSLQWHYQNDISLPTGAPNFSILYGTFATAHTCAAIVAPVQRVHRLVPKYFSWSISKSIIYICFPACVIIMWPLQQAYWYHYPHTSAAELLRCTEFPMRTW